MFLWDWFAGILAHFGFGEKTGKLLFIGLDNAGKTTLLHVLKNNTIRQHVPTLHPTSEELTIGSIKFTTFDLGGHRQAHRIWREYYLSMDAIVFFIDAFERQRWPEALEELNNILIDQSLINCPILILGNKIDRPGAASDQEMRTFFGLYGQATGQGKVDRGDIPGRPLELFMCSVLKGQGYKEAFQWVSQYID